MLGSEVICFCLLLLPLSESVIVLCFVVRYFNVHPSFANHLILMGKRELVALVSLSFWCLVVVWLFLAAPWGLSAVSDCGIS